MKKVTTEMFEPGDHVLLTTGINKGKVGIVVKHHLHRDRVEFKFAGVEYDDDCSDDDDYDDDDNDYYGEYESALTKNLKFITAKEYEQTLKDLKIIVIPGLPVSIMYKGGNLIIGHNVVTATNAAKLAEFISDNAKKITPKTKGKK